jgi:septal ring factor EnvC (AmiA/AmiB activator)
MSRTINLLAQAWKQKNNKPTINNEPANTLATTVTTRQGGFRTNRWMIGVFILSLLLLNFGLIFRLFTLVKARDSAIITSAKTLEQVEKSLDNVNQQIRIVSDDLKKIKQGNDTKIAELEKQIDTQAVMVRDLKNAKDTLFHRVNNLESGLNEIKE